MARAFTLSRLPLLPLLGLVVALLAVAAAIGLTSVDRSTNRWVAHSIRTQVAIVQLQSNVVQYESAMRGYLVRPLPVLLQDAARARAATAVAYRALEIELADNPAQLARLARVKPTITIKFQIGDLFLNAFRHGKFADALKRVRPGAGHTITADFMAITREMIDEEERLYEARSRESARISFLLVSGLAAAVVFVVVAALLTINDARARFHVMEAARDEAISARNAVAEQAALRELAEAELRQVQKMESIGQLTGGIAHDFNNMLAVVIGGLDMARRRIGHDPQRAAQSIETAMDGAERAAALVARLLAFARRQPLAPVTTDVNLLVAGMSDLLRRSLGENVRVESRLAGGLWRAFVDPGQLENAILNLAVNARDAMENRSHRVLTIATDNFAPSEDGGRPDGLGEGDYVALCIHDTGSGMDADTVARAFEPFFTTKGVGRGTGMGLAQVFGFVKQSRGHITIDSTPGQGTTVRLYLPRHDAEPVEPAAPVAAQRAPTGRREEVILVVEDEQRVRHYSVDALRELGYTVISAPNGREALGILATQPSVQLLFTDMVMPEMGGRELATAALAERPGLQILFTTGYASDLMRDDSGPLEPGMSLLSKPFTVSQLAMKIREAIDRV
ncbi:CHASE3 domain-containing protein [Sphingomonas naphthae]|uniref:histidine kinase n=1 Tax=Sphingomonas naphthae TaxID=1813468 RepID=A0ABY7TIV9_9SPHN|nr:CHASE3 domain-containing protein [Sphingomonas naphthae]WCT72355.1 CHASE3 domain-containing protein [Sphingomonas naphthae]